MSMLATKKQDVSVGGGTNNMRVVAAPLGKLTTPLFRRRGFTNGVVVTEWAAIVGERLAAHTVPERIVFPPRKHSDGTLKLRVGSSGLAVELQHVQPQLIDRINGYFGFPAVSRIQLLHGPVPTRRPRARVNLRPLTPTQEDRIANALAAIDDPDLAQALESLGRCVMGRERQR
jgi:hypothetical protein